MQLPEIPLNPPLRKGETPCLRRTHVKNRFPEVELINVTESPADPRAVWVNITAPENEDREIDLIEFAGDETTDILLDYGYYTGT